MVFAKLGRSFDQIHWPKKKSVTAHAGPEGVLMVTSSSSAEGFSPELAVTWPKQGRALVVNPQAMQKMISLAVEKIEPEEEESHYSEARRLSNIQAFGTSQNFSELAEARLSYMVRGEELGFQMERVKLNDGRYVNMPSELKGYQERSNPTAPMGEPLEPLTAEEALSFIGKIFAQHGNVELNVAKRSTMSWLQPTLRRAVESCQETLEKWTEDGGTFTEGLEVLQIELEEYRRARVTSLRQNIDGAWNWQSLYDIGEREGITIEQARQADLSFSKLDQYHMPGERVDGRLLFGEELEQSRNLNLFSQLYYRGGEVKWDGTKAKPGEIRGWSERNLFLRRCRLDRDARFAEILWKVLTWPLPMAERGLENLRQKYKTSVKENAPGPNRQRAGGRWQPAPLIGDAAIEHLRRTGKGTLDGMRVSRKVKVMKGQTWHKLFLNKSHMEALEEALLWRKGTIRLDVGGELIEEKFNQNFSGLPQEYVKRQYGGQK